MRNDDFRYMRYVGERYFDNRFATTKEIKSKLREVSLNEDQDMNTGGTPLIFDNGKVWVDDKDTHTLIVGSTGSMKSRAFILPTIVSLAQAGENMVISDPKGELFEYTSGFLKEKGYKINVLNFRDLEHSNSWNPLHEAYVAYKKGDIDTTKLLLFDLTNIIMGDAIATSKEPYWPLAGRDFLFGCLQMIICCAKDESEVNFAGLSSFLSRVYARDGNGVQEFIDVVDAMYDFSALKANLSQVVLNAESTKRGILGQVSSATSLFLRSPKLNRVVSSNAIDLHEYANPDVKTVTYIIVPDEKTSFHFFCSMFVKQLYEILIEEASKTKERTLKRRVNFILDEFANIPAIPEMSNMISAARSRNIRFFLVLQSNAQLIKKYGIEEAKNIKSNCQTWCFLNSKEMELIKEVQEYIGTDSQDRGAPLLSTGELSLLEKNFPKVQSIILMSRFRPFLSTLSDISLYSNIWKGNKPIYCPITIDTSSECYKIFSFDKNIVNPFNDDMDSFISKLMKDDGYTVASEETIKKKNDDDEFDSFMDCESSIEVEKDLDDKEIDDLINELFNKGKGEGGK